MTSPSSSLAPLVGRDRADYGVVRIRDQAFDAVQSLWRKRRDAGVTQKSLAEAINRDQGWVSKNLKAPGNWTLRTIGELVQALNGEVEIKISGIEEPVEQPSNFDAYADYCPSQKPLEVKNLVGFVGVKNPMAAEVIIGQPGSYEISVGLPRVSKAGFSR